MTVPIKHIITDSILSAMLLAALVLTVGCAGARHKAADMEQAAEFADTTVAVADSATDNGIDTVTNTITIDGVLFSRDRSILIKYPTDRQGAYIIPDGVIRIRREAFKNSTGLTSITIPNSVRTIETSAFENCISLESAVITEGVTSIWPGVFKNCSGMKSLTIPNSVTRIHNLNNEYADARPFDGCTSLVSLTIGSGVRFYHSWGNFIGLFKNVFSADDLKRHEFPNLALLNVAADHPQFTSVDGILYNKDTSALKYYPPARQGVYNIPNCVKEINELTLARSTGITAFAVADDHPTFSVVDGVLFNKDTTVLLHYPKGKHGAYIIPNSVKKINYMAFENHTGLTSITISKGMTEIPFMAFAGCTALVSVIIPEGVTAIDELAFNDCAALTSVTFPESLTEINRWAFSGCRNLISDKIPEHARIDITPSDWLKGRGKNFSRMFERSGMYGVGIGPWNGIGDGYLCGHQCNNGPEGDGCGADEEPCDKEVPTIEMVFVKGDSSKTRLVTVGDFYIGKYEVTQKQWRQVMGMRPLYYTGDDFPVISVSPQGAMEFLSKLNEMTGKNYRLPTNTEWEYAARGGNAGALRATPYIYSGSNIIDEVAWYEDISLNPVGGKRPNELGIYDMTGNVNELVNSGINNSHVSYSRYVYYARGCDYTSTAENCRLSEPAGKYRYGTIDSYTYDCHEVGGFRIALDAETDR